MYVLMWVVHVYVTYVTNKILLSFAGLCFNIIIWRLSLFPVYMCVCYVYRCVCLCVYMCVSVCVGEHPYYVVNLGLRICKR